MKLCFGFLVVLQPISMWVVLFWEFAGFGSGAALWAVWAVYFSISALKSEISVVNLIRMFFCAKVC
jgi:hypothetical protein